MSSSEKIKKEGQVIEVLPNTYFRVKLFNDGKEVLAYLAGKMRLSRIKVLLGDNVTVELNSYDEKRGRIIYRKKNESKSIS